jgi:hypothetical protein
MRTCVPDHIGGIDILHRGLLPLFLEILRDLRLDELLQYKHTTCKLGREEEGQRWRQTEREERLGNDDGEYIISHWFFYRLQRVKAHIHAKYI